MNAELLGTTAGLVLLVAIVVHLGCEEDACGDFVSPLFRLALALMALGLAVGWVVG